MAGEPSGSSSGSQSESGVRESPSGFKAYKSILNFSSTSTRADDTTNEVPTGDRSRERPPPWRRPVGAAFFGLPQVSGYDLSEVSSAFRTIMERTFAGFSDEIIGADVPIIDFRATENDAIWGVDEYPEMSQVQGERPVLYHVADDASAQPVSSSRHTCVQVQQCNAAI